MLLEVTATMCELSCEAATLSMIMSCLSKNIIKTLGKYRATYIQFYYLYLDIILSNSPKGTLREFSRWSSCSSGHISLVVGGIAFPEVIGLAQSFPN